MLVLKTLFHIGMEKIVPDKHSRRHSTGNLAFEYTDVLSRYLKDPVSSCHDNCKQSDNTNTTPAEKSNKTPPISKKIFTPIIPKHSRKDVKITNTSLLKPLPMEPKKHEFLKSKSKAKSNDPFYIPPSTSRSHRRRYSEILLPTGGLGDVLDQQPTFSKKMDTKIEPRKDPNSNSKPNSVKTPGNVNIPKKVQTLKTPNSWPKPVVDHGSRKSKPTKPPVEEPVEETRIPTSSERVIGNGCNEVQKDETLRSDDRDKEAEIPSTSKKDETLKTHDQSNGAAAASGGKKPETPRRVGKLVKENGDNLPQKIKLKQGKILDVQSSGCSQHKFRQQVVDEKNQNQDDDQKVSLRRLPSSGGLQRQESSKSVNVILKAQEVEKNKNKRHSGLNNVIEETASKLIQTRKSRVKALVGAFEMISESKL